METRFNAIDGFEQQSWRDYALYNESSFERVSRDSIRVNGEFELDRIYPNQQQRERTKSVLEERYPCIEINSKRLPKERGWDSKTGVTNFETGSKMIRIVILQTGPGERGSVGLSRFCLPRSATMWGDVDIK